MILLLHNDKDFKKDVQKIFKDLKLDFKINSVHKDIKKSIDNETDFLFVQLKENNLHEQIQELSSIDVPFVPIISFLSPLLSSFFANEGIKDYILQTSNKKILKYQIFIAIVKNARSKTLKKQMMDIYNREEILRFYNFKLGKGYIVDIKDYDKLLELVKIFDFLQYFKPLVVKRFEHNSKQIDENNAIFVTDIIGKNRIKPHNLTVLTDSIIQYIETTESPFVIIDCIEYLTLYNEFINILRNLELINSHILEKKGIMMIIIDPEAYSKKEYSLLKRYMEFWEHIGGMMYEKNDT